MQIKDSIEKYLNKCKADGLRLDTIQGKRERLFWLCELNVEVENITADMLYDLLSRKELPRSTDKKFKSDIRMFLQYLNNFKLNDTPYTVIKSAKYSYKHRPRITEEEYIKILKTCKDLVDNPPKMFMGSKKFGTKSVYKMWFAIIQILYTSGIREAELISIRMQDIDFVEKTFWVNGKGDKWRQCWYEADLEDYLREFDPKDILFPITTKNVRDLCYSLCKRAGIRQLSPHCFRHAFCSDVILSDVDPLTACNLSGHSRVQTLFDHYWHPANLKKAWSKRKLPKI